MFTFFKSDPIQSWFRAVAATGDDTMIRFAKVSERRAELEWIKVSHAEFDGIGGFADILRGQGVEVEELPKNERIQEASWWPFLKSLPKHFASRRASQEILKWKDLGRERRRLSDEALPDPVRAWHVFSEEETESLKKRARALGVSLNAVLLKMLDGAVRKDLQNEKAVIPWMVPVNLRGPLRRERDTQNHSSYLSIKVTAEGGSGEVQREINDKLSTGEHWANWKSYALGAVIPACLKRKIVRKGRATAEWNLGVFSNLGVWDLEDGVQDPERQGGWLFVAPVLRFLPFSAGVVTFQGRLSMTVQAHPDLTTSQEVVEQWLGDWRASMLGEIQEGISIVSCQ